MKILLVSSSSGSTGGGEIYLLRLALGLSRLGHHVHAVCSAAPAMDQLADGLSQFGEVRRLELLNSYRRPTRSLGAILDFEQQRRISLALQEISPDVVHINQQVAEDGLDLILAARRSGIPFLSTIHITHSANELGAKFGRLRDVVTSNVLRRANAPHITVAECARNVLINRLNFVNPHHVRVVENGVLFPDLDAAMRHQVRSRWGIGPAEVVLGSVGRLDAQKAPNFALAVVASLRRKGLPIRYVWIGDGGMRNAFQEQAQDLGITAFVRLDGWRDDVSSCLQGLDVFVMPSKFEGMPLALLEAMAAGLCCCVSDVDGMAEAIEHDMNGYLCSLGCHQGWIEQLGALVVDPANRVRVGNEARKLARRRFGIEKMAKNTLEVYKEVVTLHRAPASVA